MHWLSRELVQLERIVHTAMPGGEGDDRGGNAGGGLAAAGALREACQRLVARIAGRSGITGAFVAYEGLLVAVQGVTERRFQDALAALAQRVLGVSGESARHAELGAVQQMVLVCGNAKVALIPVGPIIVGVVCPTAVSLGRVLDGGAEPAEVAAGRH